MAFYPRCAGPSGWRLEPRSVPRVCRQDPQQMRSRVRLLLYVRNGGSVVAGSSAQDVNGDCGPYRDAHRRARSHVTGYRAWTLIMHGGEPLLAGHDLISELVCATRAAAGPGVEVTAKVQTNGVGLDDSYLRLFRELGVQVGVSLDGGAESHDRHRRFASGRGSHAAVAAGLDRLTRPHFRHLFSGLLCTIDLRNEPVATYKALAEFDPPQDRLLAPARNMGGSAARAGARRTRHPVRRLADRRI